MVMVKLTPADLAVTTGATSVASVVLQVTLKADPSDSSFCTTIWLLAVTALVSTTKVGVAPVGIATEPAAAEPHTAGLAAEAQAEAV